MYNLNIIFTRHKGSGNCNSEELYKIIDRVDPEIIFEELSVANFYRSYKDNKLVTLETTAIKLYLLENDVKQLPVDTFERPELFDEQVEFMYDKLLNAHDQIGSENLRGLIDKRELYASRYGFSFLNSRFNDALMDEFNRLKETALTILNDENLRQINALEKNVIEKREDQMLANIYWYSKDNPYRQGLFFIGSGHRESILKKIKKFYETCNLKINWIIHDCTEEPLSKA